MAAPPCASSLLIVLVVVFVHMIQSAPAPSGRINIIAILDKAGNYVQFIRLLKDTQADVQINNQINNSHNGMTVFAPSDNAFSNLPAGALNNLTDQQHVQLVLYHICPMFYSLGSLQTVSNPVRTQASGQDGLPYGLFISATADQINVSTGVVSVPIYNALMKDFPLGVYQVDTVLLPIEFYEATPPEAATPSSSTRSRSGRGRGSAMAPLMGNPAGKSGAVAPLMGNQAGNDGAVAPSTGNPAGNGGTLAPSTGNTAGNGGGVAPSTGSGVAPSTGNHAGNGGAVAPSTGNSGGIGGAVAPSTGNTARNGGGKMGVGLGLIVWLLFIVHGNIGMIL